MDFPLDLAGALGRRVQPYNMSTKEHTNEGKAHFDRRAFRNALGRFPTGVTVVTTLTPDGSPIGLTANSFSSVSLDPPMVLWSLAKSASTLPIFLNAPHYAINVLAADQIALSRQFASVRGDRFKGVKCRLGLGGAPRRRGSHHPGWRGGAFCRGGPALARLSRGRLPRHGTSPREPPATRRAAFHRRLPPLSPRARQSFGERAVPCPPQIPEDTRVPLAR